MPTDADQVHVDCTAYGVAPTDRGPIFQPGLVDMNITTFGIVPWSAALIAYVEATRDDDGEKNRLCPVLRLTGEIDDSVSFFSGAFRCQGERMAEPDLVAWMDTLRLNPGSGLNARLDEPEIQAAMTAIMTGMEPALENLDKLVAG